MCVSTIATGRLLDRDFRAIKTRIAREQDLEQRRPISAVTEVEKITDENEVGKPDNLHQAPPVRKPFDHNDLSDFPIEHARLRSMPIC